MDEMNKDCGCGCGHDHHEHEHNDCGCGHDHEQTMTLVLEDNSEMQCSVLGVFEVEEKEYIALLPIGDDEVLLYRYMESDNEDGFELLNIESDEEFESVEDAFFELFDAEDFEDEDFDEDEDEEDGEE